MAAIISEGGSGDGEEKLPRSCPPIATDLETDPIRPACERPSTRVWRRPGAGAVPTRTVADLFDFSSIESTNEALPEGAEVDPTWLDARRSAFRMLDEWLTWDSVVDDESVFTPERVRLRNARYEFALSEVIAEPADVLHYSLRTFSVFL